MDRVKKYKSSIILQPSYNHNYHLVYIVLLVIDKQTEKWRSLNIITFSYVQTLMFLNSLEEWFSRYHSWTSSILGKLIRNVNYEAPCQTSQESKALVVGPVLCNLTSPSGDSNAHESLRTSISVTNLILCAILTPTTSSITIQGC